MEIPENIVIRYDKLGRLAVSQNAQQKIGNKYSYTLYDLLGRINEVGQKPQAVNSMSQVVSQDPVALNNWINVAGGVKEQITATMYDQPYAPFIIPDPLLTQKNLRNRVSYTTFKNLASDVLHYTGTFYTYDVHGNVDTLLQDYAGIAAMNSSGNRFKLMTYDYDLISGKVNRVSYQPKNADAFYHRYFYDAENRITSVETSRDKIVWERDAAYNYYKHGPLARMVLGQNQVQGNDYAYTLQGWLKGMNSTTVSDGTFDMGTDGLGVNAQVARDVFGFSLNYYNNDYKAIAVAAKPFAPITNAVGLFNGNIAAMAVNIPKIGEPLLYNYRYDQLNRLLSMNAFKGLNAVNNTFVPIAVNDYAEAISYDPNGNIVTYKRNGSAAQLDMDKMTYQYPKDALGNALNNRLRYVHDEVAAANYGDDIDTQTPLTLAQVQAEKLPEQLTDNYGYDAIGNLVKDTKEGIGAIDWNVYGKIKSITKAGNTIAYSYDAAGNRISKIMGAKSTFYVRDASGNVMSVYSIDPLVNQGKILQSEVHLYGSSRLGILGPLSVAPQIKPVASGFGTGILSTFTRGEKFFELSNHLGNVLVTVSDKKIAYSFSQQCDGNDCWDVVTGYTADVLSANDYAPFGMSLSGRKFGVQGRYGFNGKENDKDISEGAQDYGMRINEVRLGRFLSVDPITNEYPELTPYQFASNNPISGIDLDGLEHEYYLLNWNDKNGKATLTKTSTVETTSFLFFEWQLPHVVYVSYPGGSDYNHEFKFTGVDIDNLFDWANNPQQYKWNDGNVKAFEAVFPSEAAKFMGDINSALSHAPVMVMSAPRNASKSATPNSNTNKQSTAANNGNKEITESNIVSHGSTSIIKKANRTGDQVKLKETVNNTKASSADKGWIKQEINQIDRGKRTTIRRPPGKVLAHERGREAAKGYSYKHSNLQTKELHKLQHKYDKNGTLNKERPIKE